MRRGKISGETKKFREYRPTGNLILKIEWVPSQAPQVTTSVDSLTQYMIY